MASLKNTTINDTGYIRLPSGTTAQRPESPVAGMMRYNTDYTVNEYYDGTEWVAIRLPSGTTAQRPESPVAGMMRYNNDYAVNEYYDGTEWIAIGYDTLVGTSASSILNDYPSAPDGIYKINLPTVGVTPIYCIMNSSFDGGGWMSVNSIISPQVSNVGTSSTWQANSGNILMGGNNNVLNVTISETDCGGTSFYQLRNPSTIGISYTRTLLLMQRVSTIGQCSQISGGTANGYYNGPIYQGSYTQYGMCRWGDGYFANACCNAQNLSGLQLYWVMKGSGTNPDLNYSVQCASGSGRHYHQWYIK